MAAHSEPLHDKGQELRRSSDFWFKKGDFVLVTNSGEAYRIHGDVVGRKSTVFRDLLDLDEVPRPEYEQMVDGCPVVNVTDSPDDLNTFLSLLYDGFEHLRRHVQEPRWTTVRVMILLGDKYDVPDIREEGLRQLRAWYADDIDAWDKRDEAFFADKTDHLSVASITRVLGEPKLHAAVLYHCCRLWSSQLVTGSPATGCPPLCTQDLINTLTYLKNMCPHYMSVSSRVCGKQLCDELLACAKCRRVCHTVQVATSGYISSSIDYKAYKILDESVWRGLSQVIEGLVCEQCFSHYKSLLQRTRQTYRDSLSFYVIRTP